MDRTVPARSLVGHLKMKVGRTTGLDCPSHLRCTLGRSSANSSFDLFDFHYWLLAAVEQAWRDYFHRHAYELSRDYYRVAKNTKPLPLLPSSPAQGPCQLSCQCQVGHFRAVLGSWR